MLSLAHDSFSSPLFATMGTFDGVHRGHCFLIEQVKAEALRRGWESGVITFTPHPRQVLHPNEAIELLTLPEERRALLEEIAVDRIIELNFTRELASLSAREFLHHLHDVYHLRGLVVGHDHRFGHNRAEDFEHYVEYGREMGVEVLRAERLVVPEGPVGSTHVRTLVARGNVAEAHLLLGHPYSLQGEVVGGHRVGRKLGFPTANIAVKDSRKLIPAHGVYAVRVILPGGTRHNGMLNIGCRPTIQQVGVPTIETHLFDYEGDLYGIQLTIEFIDYMRCEQTFPGIEALQAQLMQDSIAVRQRLGDR